MILKILVFISIFILVKILVIKILSIFAQKEIDKDE